MTNSCSQNNWKLCFMSLNISGVRKCKYLDRYKNQSYLYLLKVLNGVGLFLSAIPISLIIEIKSLLKLHVLKFDLPVLDFKGKCSAYS